MDLDEPEDSKAIRLAQSVTLFLVLSGPWSQNPNSFKATITQKERNSYYELQAVQEWPVLQPKPMSSISSIIRYVIPVSLRSAPLNSSIAISQFADLEFPMIKKKRVPWFASGSNVYLKGLTWTISEALILFSFRSEPGERPDPSKDGNLCRIIHNAAGLQQNHTMLFSDNKVLRSDLIGCLFTYLSATCTSEVQTLNSPTLEIQLNDLNDLTIFW